jgi:uncharacterized membrane protein
MRPVNKTEAQRLVDQIRTFQRELDRLEEERVLHLTEAQRGALTAHHQSLLARCAQRFDIDRSQEAKQLSLGMRIASFLGALALAASVFFLFYQFWGRFSTAEQVVILVAAPIVLFVATMLVDRRDESGYFVKLVAMVAFACFVLNVVMLGDIFNITPSDKALLPWAAFAFLLAYALDIRLLLAAGILCLIAFLSARTGTWSGMYWLHFGERPENFLPAGILLFVFPWLVDHRRFSGFAPVYRVFGLLTLFLPILILANYGPVSYLDLDRDLIEGLYQLAGFALSAAAIYFGIRRHWPDVVNTGNTFFVIFLYTKFYDWWWEIMPKYLFFLVIGLTAILFLLVFRRLRLTRNLAAPEPRA